jgi:hypothetical protein
MHEHALKQSVVFLTSWGRRKGCVFSSREKGRGKVRKKLLSRKFLRHCSSVSKGGRSNAIY